MRRRLGDEIRATSLVEAGDGDFFETSLDHLCVAGFDGYWKRLNPSWMRTLGWTAQELMSRPLIEFCHPDDREATLAARRRLTEGVPLRDLTNRYRAKDGTYRWFEWRSVSHLDRRVVYAVARDVTASLRTLAAGVAHGVNNPLAYVKTNLEMIAEELRQMDAETMPVRTAECLQMAGEASHGVERIRRVVRGLESLSRTSSEQRVLIEVHEALERAVAATSETLGDRATLVRDYKPVPPVHADASRLSQVFVHLLLNATQAIAEGNPEGNEIRIITFTDGSGHAVVEIRDTGHGIPESALPYIFDPFFTTKAMGTGTGLGLSICHTIVSSLGGQITASNSASGGAVLRVVLPAASISDRATPGASGAP